MPVLKQNFHHTMDACKAVTAGMYDYTGKLTTVTYSYKQPSELFWADLKSMLENLPGLDFTFSESDIYEAGVVAPTFKLWDLEFSAIVALTCSNANCYTLTPFILRQYEYSPWSFSFKELGMSAKDMSACLPPITRINKDSTNYLELDYTIEIRYNEDFLLIEYRPYGDKTIKFTLCCLIKGTDINGKSVIYESGGCNTNSTGSMFSYNYHWLTYHKLVWSESPKVNPYTNIHSYPAYNTSLNIDRGVLSNDIIFMDLVNNVVTPHTSKITFLNNENLVFQKPICCWGRIEFSDNVLTGPTNLTVDTDYEINGETYYCPGDYITIQSMQYGINYARYGAKILLKI